MATATATKRHAYPSKTVRSVGNVQVHRFRMAGLSGTGVEEYQYAAYVPVSGCFNAPYSTITSDSVEQSDGTFTCQWLGQIGTERLTPALEALPARSPERFEAVMAYFDRNHEQAYRYIVEAFPEAGGGNRSTGRIALALKCTEHRCTMTCYES